MGVASGVVGVVVGSFGGCLGSGVGGWCRWGKRDRWGW